MAVRNFASSSIQTGVKRSKFWDQSTVIPFSVDYLVVAGGGGGGRYYAG